MEKNDLNSLLLAFILSIVPTMGYGSVQTTASVKKVVHTCKKTDTPVNILACNMYREARGESDKGMISVGFVTMNRKDQEDFPETIKKIVYQPGQFSWTSSAPKFNVHDVDDWNRAKKFSTTLIFLHTYHKDFYKTVDPTQGALYYHSKKVKPYWAKLMKRTVVIENHAFYKPKKPKEIKYAQNG